MSYPLGAPPVQFDASGKPFYGTPAKDRRAALPPSTDTNPRPPVIPPGTTPPDPRVVPPRQPPVPPAGQYGGPGITGGPDPAALENLYKIQQSDRPGAPGVVGAGPSGGFTVMGSPGVQAGYNTLATGETLARDPSLKAAVDAFNAYQRPTIENQMATAGLGRSNALGNATALALGQQLTPLMESALQREQQAQTTGYGAVENELNRRQQLDINQSNANLATIPYLVGMGENQYQRGLGQIGAAEQFGGMQRGIEQEQNDAAYQDFLRRQSLAEQGTYAPFGQTVPTAFGSRSITSKS